MGRWALDLFIQIVLLVILMAVLVNGAYPSYMDKSFLASVLLVDLLSLVSFFFIRREQHDGVRRQYVRLSIIFLFSFVVVHFQAYFDLILGNADEKDRFLWIDYSVVARSSLISSIAMICYIIGYNLHRCRLTVNYKTESRIGYVNTKWLNLAAMALLMTFFVTVNPNYLKGNYGSESVGSAAMMASFLFEAIAYAIIVLNCRNLTLGRRYNITFWQYVYTQRWIALLLVFYLAAVMLSGDRGAVIYCSAGLFFGYVYVSQKKIPVAVLMLLIVGSALFITILGLVRKEDKSKNFSDRVTMVLDGNGATMSGRDGSASISGNTQELSTSVRTVHIAVSKIPSTFPHTYGLFAMQDALLFIPGLKGAIINFFSIPRQFTSSAQLLTWIDLGPFATWGVGTSCVADVFIDFGLIGVLLVFFIFGFYSRRMEVLAFSGRPIPLLALIAIFLVFSFSVYIPRATILYSLNKFTYVAFFVYLPIWFKSKRKKSKVM